jgi:SAM-dependent methyltransferase
VCALPLDLPASAEAAFVAAFDRAGKLVRGLEALGPIVGRDVTLVDGQEGMIAAGVEALGGRLTNVPLTAPLRLPVPDASTDVVVGAWSAFRGVDAAEMAEVDRALRPDGRLLAVHDYGRDDLARLRGERPEYGPWSHRSGPFLAGGFRVRVVHCWLEFESLADAGSFLGQAFGDGAADLAAGLKRPRLSYNVAIYHRSRA